MSAIRAASPQDVPGVYRVCLETGASGQDATARFRNPDLLGHVYAGPYLAVQPRLAYVVADADGVGGYLLAAADTRAFETWAEAHWWPLLRRQYPLVSEDRASDAGYGRRNAADGEVIRLLHFPPAAPDEVVAGHPAHLHIDLLPRVQGRGFGRALVEMLLDVLRTEGAAGVHLEVGPDNTDAIAFYRHLGFEHVLDESGSRWMAMGLR